MTTRLFPLPNENATSTPHFNPFHLQRILLVACDLKLIELNAEVLREAGYHVSTASNGLAAWDAIQVSNFDLLITDQFLPMISGVELIQNIYAANLDLPVIMATGILPTWKFIQHPCLNSITMLKKPYTTEKLLSVIETVLNQAMLGREKIAPVSCCFPSESQVPQAIRATLWPSLI